LAICEVKKMIQKLAIIGVTLSLLATSTLPAFAAKPANLACLGEDFSGYARNGETNPTSFVSLEEGLKNTAAFFRSLT